MITVHSLPEAVFTAPAEISIVDPTVQFENNSINATSWTWDFGDPDNADLSKEENPSHKYSRPGTYCTILYAKNNAGCKDTTEYCVIVAEEYTIYIPNAFTPDGDGLNDEFYPKGEFINEIEMSIYDRWGNLMFYSNDVNKHWNGLVKNESEPVLMDVYVYKINIKEGKYDRKHQYIGSVTIVK
jgi:gliding motility-associated-like protein